MMNQFTKISQSHINQFTELIGKENTRDDIIAPVKLTRDCCLSAPSFNPNSLPITDTLYGKVEWGETNIDSNW